MWQNLKKSTANILLYILYITFSSKNFISNKKRETIYFSAYSVKFQHTQSKIIYSEYICSKLKKVVPTYGFLASKATLSHPPPGASPSPLTSIF